MHLVQVRPCDGQCCKDGPRFPNADHSDCIFHDNQGCAARRNPSLIPDGDCPAYPRFTAADAIIQCRRHPHNREAQMGKTQNCCFQWVDS